MLKRIKNKKGDGYVEVCISALVLITLAVILLNIFELIMLRISLGQTADDLITTACYSGVSGISALARSLASEILLYSFILICSDNFNDTPDSHSSAADSFLLRFFKRFLTALEVFKYGILKISSAIKVSPIDKSVKNIILKII